MQCSKCNGCGMRENDQWKHCNQCNAVKDEPLTNEQWLNNMTTIQKAEQYASWFRKAIWSMQRGRDISELSNELFWEHFLQEEHKEKEDYNK